LISRPDLLVFSSVVVGVAEDVGVDGSRSGVSLMRTWDRCYDHNFLLFLTIFGEKIGVFLKNQCYDRNFA
jgi:hypothetical protein